jgi:hypothetical protein
LYEKGKFYIRFPLIIHRRYLRVADNKGETWTSWLALTTAILAVLAAITTLYMGKYSSRAITSQGQETNQWSYYQSKSIKSYMYHMEKQRLELEIISARGKASAEYEQKARQIIAGCTDKIGRYEKEKEEIKAKAEATARGKEIAQMRAGSFGYGLIFLQIAIMLSSVAALTKKKHLWQFSLISVVGWVYYYLDAVFLFR